MRVKMKPNLESELKHILEEDEIWFELYKSGKISFDELVETLVPSVAFKLEKCSKLTTD
jgi:uncharacterized damage-inducible protein DinB